MAEFTISINNKYGVDTYQETKNTYDWIMSAIKKLNFENVKIREQFVFKISKCTCDCDNIEEFIENAYEQNDYELIYFVISVYSNNVSELFISTGLNDDIKISANKKVLLEKFEKILGNTFLEQDLLNKHTSPTYIGNVTNNTISIKGDNNTIANDNSSVEIERDNEKAKLKSLLTAIWQNICANIVWWFLCFIFAMMLGYFGFKK